MATIEGLKPVGSDMLPTDPNVRIPDHVKAAAAAAENIHKQAYAGEPEPEPAPEPTQAPEPAPAAAAQPEPAPQQAQPQAVEHTPLKPGEENITAEEWRHRFLSMQGRYNAAARDKGAMEEQMRQLGEELIRTQNLLATVQHPPQTQQPTISPNHGNLITDEDRANYGDELIDLSRRAALSAITPELEQLRAENERLTKRVQNTSRRELFATLDGAVPNWRAINNSVQFKTWLRLPNIYTGQARAQMLQAAVNGAEAPKVIALLKDFLAEAAATGQQVPTAQIEQQPAPAAAPRQPAVSLESLAAPGRARPASGDSQVPSEKPIYSRAQISKFYDDKRRGAYAGRDAEVVAFEADLSAAQREGRIRG